MVTSHQRKRLNGVSIAGFNSLDQKRTKKKKSELPKDNLNGKSLISLEWDDSQSKVVAKREQISIISRDMIPFTVTASMRHCDLADVFTIPQEVLELENLAQVLPYQVWQTHLSRKEKKFLMQFLPQGQDTEEVVQKLFSGDNFHFGNPLLKWSASLCSGNLHPDSVLHQEQSLKYHKKAYYLELQNYHKGMIQYLQKLKDAWETTSVPEKEALPKIWRSRKDAERRISLHSHSPEFSEPEDNILATSESYSLIAEEKACSSDTQNSKLIRGGDLPKRIDEKGTMKEKGRKFIVSSNDAIHQSDKLQKYNIHHSDGTKYMSYLKISKKQLELVKSMKQAGRSIQSTSLNSILGNVDTLHVQPYEEFVKEEKMKLQEHWLQLANKELPAAYANWEERKFQKQEMTKSLDREMKERLNSPEDIEKEDKEIVFQNQVDQELSKLESIMMGEKKGSHKTFILDKNDQGERNSESILEDNEHSSSDFLQSLSPRQISSLSGGYDPNLAGINSEINQSPQNHNTHRVPVLVGGHNLILVDTNSENDQSPEQISSLSGGYDLNPMDMNSQNNHVDCKSDGTSRLSVNSGNGNTIDDSNSQGVPITSGGDVWAAVSVPSSYDDSTANLEYPSTNRLNLLHEVNEEQGSQMIDLEAHVPEHGTVKYFSHRQSDDGSLGSYQNHSFLKHDRSGLLQSLFKSQGMLPYNHDQKQMALDFQSQSNMMMENGQFPRHLQGQLYSSLQLQDEQKRLDEDCMHQNLTDAYTEEGGYVTPAQGNMPPIDMQDWNINPTRMSEQLQSHLNDDGLLTNNWYSGEHHVCDGWTGVGAANVPSQSIGCNADQGLFGVLSHCNQLSSSSTYESMRSTEQQLVLPRNYGIGGWGIPRMDNSLPPVAHPVDYLSVRDTTNSLIPDDMGWINLPQNSTLHDPLGKPYLRSWNQ